MKTTACIIAIALSASLALAQTKPIDARATTQPADKTQAQRPADFPDATLPPEARGDIQKILDSRIPRICFNQAPFDHVMEWVGEYTDTMVYVRWDILEQHGIDRDTPITVKARGRKLSQILWAIMNQAATDTGETLAYQASTELILLSTHRDLCREMITKVYDVTLLLQEIPDFLLYDDNNAKRDELIRLRTREKLIITKVERGPAPIVRFGEIGSATGNLPTKIETNDEMLQELMEIILITIEPESWASNGFGGEGTIIPSHGKIIVRNNRYVHQLIDGAIKPKPEAGKKAKTQGASPKP